MTELPAFDTLKLTFEGDMLIATLARPARANAVSNEMLRDLIALADWLNGNDAVRFLIIAGEGPIFAAGQDLREVRDELRDGVGAGGSVRALQRSAQEMMHKLEGLEQISFAALEGSAYGAGVAIAMTADFRVMADDAVLNLPETKIGMFLTYGAIPRLVAAMGASRAKAFVMFAADVSAHDAERFGLVQTIAPRGEVLAIARAQIDELRQKDFRSLRITKRIAQAAAAVNVGDILVSEPELSEGVLTDGTTLRLVEGFFEGRH